MLASKPQNGVGFLASRSQEEKINKIKNFLEKYSQFNYDYDLDPKLITAWLVLG